MQVYVVRMLLIYSCQLIVTEGQLAFSVMNVTCTLFANIIFGLPDRGQFCQIVFGLIFGGRLQWWCFIPSSVAQ